MDEEAGLIGRLLCFLGRHDWLYDSPRHDANRFCRRCGRWEHPVYDMAYGGTYYIEGFFDWGKK